MLEEPCLLLVVVVHAPRYQEHTELHRPTLLILPCRVVVEDGGCCCCCYYSCNSSISRTPKPITA